MHFPGVEGRQVMLTRATLRRTGRRTSGFTFDRSNWQLPMGLDSGVFISLLFYLAYAGVALIPYLVRRTSLKDLDPLDPYFILSILLFFYIVSTLIDFEATGLADTLESVSSLSVVKFGFACLVGQIGLAAGELASPVQSWQGFSNNTASTRDIRLSLLVGPGLALAIIMLPFYVERLDVFNVSSYADTAFESRIERLQDQAAGLKDVFLKELPSSLLLCACTALVLDRNRLLAVRLGAGTVLALYALTSTLGGARGILVATAMLPLMYFHYHVRKFSLLTVGLMGIAGVLVINVLSIARVSSNPEEMIAAVTEQIGVEGYGFLGVSGSGELKTSANLVRLIVGIDTGEDGYRAGEVLWSNIASTVPRTFWPERPPTGSELFAEVFYPGSLQSGAGYASFLFQDPYWDFSFAGVFAFGFALAWTMRKLYASLLVRNSSPFWTLVYAIVYANLVISVVRSGIFAGIKAAQRPEFQSA